MWDQNGSLYVDSLGLNVCWWYHIEIHTSDTKKKETCLYIKNLANHKRPKKKCSKEIGTTTKSAPETSISPIDAEQFQIPFTHRSEHRRGEKHAVSSAESSSKSKWCFSYLIPDSARRTKSPRRFSEIGVISSISSYFNHAGYRFIHVYKGSFQLSNIIQTNPQKQLIDSQKTIPTFRKENKEMTKFRGFSGRVRMFQYISTPSQKTIWLALESEPSTMGFEHFILLMVRSKSGEKTSWGW